MKRVFSSIFHEANIPIVKPPNPQDSKVNMNISISQKSIPKVRALIANQDKQDARMANEKTKQQAQYIEKQQRSAENKAKMASAPKTESFLDIELI